MRNQQISIIPLTSPGSRLLSSENTAAHGLICLNLLRTSPNNYRSSYISFCDQASRPRAALSSLKPIATSLQGLLRVTPSARAIQGRSRGAEGHNLPGGHCHGCEKHLEAVLRVPPSSISKTCKDSQCRGISTNLNLRHM